MSNDLQFLATGPAPVGYQTANAGIDTGGVFVGQTTGAVVTAAGPGDSVTALSASSRFGSAMVGGNLGGDGDPDVPVGIYGESLVSGGTGVRGKGDVVGVWGETTTISARGFLAGRDLLNQQLAGVYGESSQQGVYGMGTGDNGTGVYGVGRFGVRGDTGDGIGVKGVAQGKGVGLWGEASAPDGGIGVVGISQNSDAVQGNSHSAVHAGVSGLNDGGGIGVYGQGATAGLFQGPVTVNGNLTIGGGGDVILADCAEEFRLAPVGSAGDPGSVMVIDDAGLLRPCDAGYDKRAVGVISGAGAYRPAIVLNRQEAAEDRAPIALVGKVCCKVDAGYAAVEVGDLLTSSPTIGHAMKVCDLQRAFGTVVGKALEPLASGCGMIAILVALQ